METAGESPSMASTSGSVSYTTLTPGFATTFSYRTHRHVDSPYTSDHQFHCNMANTKLDPIEALRFE